MKVNKQVKVPISILGRYDDEIQCDVPPMSTSHIILGRSFYGV